MGRTAWSDVVKNVQSLGRLIWFHVPLRLTPKTPQELLQPVVPSRTKEEVETVMDEKRMAVDLLEGFAVALKHHLRGEYDIYYEDLYHLVEPLHESVTPRLLPASGGQSPSLFDKVSADLIPFATYLQKLGHRSPGLGPKARRRIARGNENLPVEILRLISDWFAVLEERATVPGTSLGMMIATIPMLEDSLSSAEKLLSTSLPFVYAVHISEQSYDVFTLENLKYLPRIVWIYLFFLPFQLVSQFSWYTIPGVGIAAFIYLGFLAAGEEIAQPFGYDENDLDLDLICREIIHPDISRLKETPGLNVSLSPHEATPYDVPPQAGADLLEM
ncbi:Bestrophin, RFP-TM, chloride channel-domain-containing protein [Russula brevipes]|nr:Bestrophin, RFP-TM, chloride channel-domain-containing protein [Russula brevipes]